MIDHLLVMSGAIAARHVPRSRARGAGENVYVIDQSVITCPKCRLETLETMPADACQFFYECGGCGEVLQPKSGDCCVFCSYGSVPCPPIQEADGKHGCYDAP